MTDPAKTVSGAATSGLFSTPAVAEAAAAPKETPAEDKQEVIEPEAPPVPQVDERELLMQRARLIGVEFSNNIGTETLRERIRAKMEALEEAEAPEPEPAPEPEVVNALTGEPTNTPKKTFRQQQIDEQMRLVRIRITCMDPKKKDLQGEIFTIANEYIGTVRKFVPFGEVTDEGFHVPFCIYNMMTERQFLNIRTVKDKRSGAERPETQYSKEFAIEVLPQLTPAELGRLANAQAAAGSIGD